MKKSRQTGESGFTSLKFFLPTLVNVDILLWKCQGVQLHLLFSYLHYGAFIDYVNKEGCTEFRWSIRAKNNLSSSSNIIYQRVEYIFSCQQKYKDCLRSHWMTPIFLYIYQHLFIHYFSSMHCMYTMDRQWCLRGLQRSLSKFLVQASFTPKKLQRPLRVLFCDIIDGPQYTS